MQTELPEYTIQWIDVQTKLTGNWDGSVWKHIRPLEIASFRPESSSHRPVTRCKLQYNAEGLWGIFKVQDQFVRCIHTEFQSEVYNDSCVEFFLQPKAGKGYFNFEFNCGGALLAYHIHDPGRMNGKFKNYKVLPSDADAQIKRFHSSPSIVDPEVSLPMDWCLEFFIPFSVMEDYIGPIDLKEVWRGNCFKCGDETSHPHWASWSAVDELNFHQPDKFGHFILSDM